MTPQPESRFDKMLDYALQHHGASASTAIEFLRPELAELSAALAAAPQPQQASHRLAWLLERTYGNAPQYWTGLSADDVTTNAWDACWFPRQQDAYRIWGLLFGSPMARGGWKVIEHAFQGASAAPQPQKDAPLCVCNPANDEYCAMHYPRVAGSSPADPPALAKRLRVDQVNGPTLGQPDGQWDVISDEGDGHGYCTLLARFFNEVAARQYVAASACQTAPPDSQREIVNGDKLQQNAADLNAENNELRARLREFELVALEPDDPNVPLDMQISILKHKDGLVNRGDVLRLVRTFLETPPSATDRLYLSAGFIEILGVWRQSMESDDWLFRQMETLFSTFPAPVQTAPPSAWQPKANETPHKCRVIQAHCVFPYCVTKGHRSYDAGCVESTKLARSLPSPPPASEPTAGKT